MKSMILAVLLVLSQATLAATAGSHGQESELNPSMTPLPPSPTEDSDSQKMEDEERNTNFDGGKQQLNAGRDTTFESAAEPGAVKEDQER